MIWPTLTYVPVFSVVMIMIGLGLTVWEFRSAQTNRHTQRASQRKRMPQRLDASVADKVVTSPRVMRNNWRSTDE